MVPATKKGIDLSLRLKANSRAKVVYSIASASMLIMSGAEPDLGEMRACRYARAAHLLV
jgi:hypothetical protein